MRTLRYIASLLLIMGGVLHVLSFIQAPQDPNALSMLVFGIIYFLSGILLFLNMKYSAALGIVFPLIGIGAGVFVIGPSNASTMLGIMFAIDVLVVICCSVLFYRKTR